METGKRRTGLSSDYETFITRGDGEERAIEVHATPIFGEDGDFEGTLASVEDVTERKRAEESLSQSHQQFMTIFEQAPLGIAIIDSKTGHIYEANPRFAEIVGRPRTEVQTIDWMSITHPDDVQASLDNMERLNAGEIDGFRMNKRYILPDGTYAWINMTIAPIHESDDLGERHLCMVEDITEQRRAEDAVRVIEEQLRQAQKLESVGRLAGGVAHDFNNLLTTIIGYSELISEEQDLTMLTKERVQEIRDSADRAAALTRQLLAFSRKQVLQPRVIDLNSLIANLSRMLRRLVGEDIDLTTEFDSDALYIKADPGQVEQVIINLAVNSRDAMADGGKLKIEAKCVHLDESYNLQHPELVSGDYVMLAVSDTGCGMDEETKNQIFEPFYTTKEIGKGTGLGLSTVYGIVRQSGGFIWVDSEPDHGTTFKIYLPQVAGTTTKQEDLPLISGPMHGTETILLVEDDESLRKLAAKILKGYGYAVVEAQNGVEALEIAAKRNYPAIDLLVTDVIMPQMNGRQLSEAILKEYPDMKVLFISGYTDNSIVHHGVLGEGVSFLQKPFSPQSLAEKVRDVLDEN